MGPPFAAKGVGRKEIVLLGAIRRWTFAFAVIGFGTLPVAAAAAVNDQLPIETVPNIPNSPYTFAFSSDGARLLSAGDEGTLKLWDVASGRLIRTFVGHANYVYSVVFSSDGSRIVSASKDKTIKLWDAATGSLLRTTQLQSRAKELWHIALSPDGTLALSGQSDSPSDGTMKLWDAATGRLLRSFPAEAYTGVFAVAFSPDGRRALSSGGKLGSRAKVKLWDVATGRLLRSFEGHETFTTVDRVAFSPDGTRVLSGSWDKTMNLWDAASGQLLRTFTHPESVTAVAFSPDGKLVVSGSHDKTARLWDAASGRFLHAFPGHYWRVSAVTFTPDGSRVLSGGYGYSMKVWDVTTGKLAQEFGGRQKFFSRPAYSPDGTFILSGGRSLNCWDATSGQLLSTLPAPNDAFTRDFSRDGARVLWGMADKKFMQLCDATTGRVLAKFEGHSKDINHGALSHDGRRVLSGGLRQNHETMGCFDRKAPAVIPARE